MRRLVATSVLIACSGLAAGCGLVDADDDKRAELGSLETLRAKGFTIKLPCIPAESKDSMPVPGGDPATLRTWMCDGGDIAYSLSTIVLNDEMQVNLDGAAKGAADAVDGKVDSNKKVTFAGAPGRDLRITSVYDGEPATGFMRVLVHERTIYQVSVVLFEDDLKKPPTLYQKVLKSLSFT